MDHATELGHVHLKVRDVDRAVEFYRDVLGLDVNERAGRFAFLSFGEKHHDLALQGIGSDAPGPTRGVGLYTPPSRSPTPRHSPRPTDASASARLR